MFSIRFYTSATTTEDGWPHAGGELVVGEARVCFLVDLSHWRMGDYHRHWRAGIARLVQGAALGAGP